MTADAVTLDDLMAELRAIRAEVAELRGDRRAAPPVDPVVAALAAVEAVFRGLPATTREIADRAARLPADRLADPLRRAFGSAEPRVIGRRLGELALRPADGFNVERSGSREGAGHVWTVTASGPLCKSPRKSLKDFM